MVRDLIDGNTNQWDTEKIFDLFAYWTRMDIMAIPLQQDTARDVLIWKETKSGSILVKSAYQVAIRMMDTTQIEHSSTRIDRPF